MPTNLKLYNVVVRVVDLVWATDEADAINRLASRLSARDEEVMPDGSSAFVSEPVPEMGWEGDDEPLTIIVRPDGSSYSEGDEA